MGAKAGAREQSPRSVTNQCGLDPLLLAAVLAAKAREQAEEASSEMSRDLEIERGHQRLTLRERQTHLVMGVVIQLFAMGYLVAILLLAPLLLAPTGLAAAYLWRRG
jgi:hypothetical protein